MTRRNAIRIVLPPPIHILLFGFAFLVEYGFGTALTQDAGAPFWFPGAVLLCALLLSRPNEWWLYVLATLPIRLFLFVPPGTPRWFLLVCFATDALKALVAAWLLRDRSRDRGWFDNLHEFMRYCLVAVLLAPGLSAFAVAAARNALGNSFWTSWAIWFFGGALAGFALAPFILLALNYKRFVLEYPNHLRVFLAAAGLVLTTYIALRFGPIAAGFLPFLLLLPVPFLLWAAIGFGPGGASGSLVLMSALSILVTGSGQGAFQLQPHEAGLLSMQLFLFCVSVPVMFLSVITYQQRGKFRETEERFRSLADVAPAMLWMSGADASCTFFNKAWLDFTGLSLKQQGEQDWVVRVHPQDRERCVNEYLSAFKSRADFSLEYQVLRQDGVYRWVVHNGVPRYAADGAFLGYIGSRVDFTDRRDSEERLRDLATQLINAQETERARIGQELHDDLAQQLCALLIGLGRFSRKFDGNGSLTRELDELQLQVRDISDDLRRLSHQLNPATVEGLGLPAALRNLCRHARDDGRAVLFVQNENLPSLPDQIALPLYRIAQEALRNALTHSGATYIHVELSASSARVRLSVRDNGCGFVVGSVTKPGLGLSGMSERMRSVGGGFSIISNPGEGTAVIATMPLAQSMKVGSTA